MTMPRSVHGPTLRVLPKAVVGVWNARHQGEHTSRGTAPDRVVFVLAGPTGEGDTVVHSEELPESDPAHHRGESGHTRM